MAVCFNIKMKYLPVKNIMVEVAHISQESIDFPCYTDSKNKLLLFSYIMSIASFVLEARLPPAYL